MIERAPVAPRIVASSTGQPTVLDLSGEWDVLEVEDDKRYRATLDKTGNGPYTQHGGQFVTTKFTDRLWQGTWRQPGNDREGGFELLLSEDGTQAKGVWWYTRVGTDLPAAHEGDLAASMLKHSFQLPNDMYMVGYKTSVFTKQGKPLSRTISITS